MSRFFTTAREYVAVIAQLVSLFWRLAWAADKWGALLSLAASIFILGLLAAETWLFFTITATLRLVTNLVTSGGREPASLLTALIEFSVWLLARLFVQTGGGVVRTWLNSWACSTIRRAAFDRLINATPSVYAEDHSAALSNRCDQGIALDRENPCEGIYQVASNILLALASGVVIALDGGGVAFLIEMILVLLVAGGVILLWEKVQQRGDQKHDAEDRLKSAAAQAVKLGRSFRLAERERQAAREDYARQDRTLTRLVGGYRSLVTLLGAVASLGGALSLLVLFWLFVIGRGQQFPAISAGALAVIVNALQQIATSIAGVVAQQERFDKIRAEVKRLLPLWSLPQRKAPDWRPTMPLAEIRVKNASLLLAGQQTPLVGPVSARFHVGSSYVVVGPNAAGKRTLAGLSSGWLKPSGGEVVAVFRDDFNEKAVDLGTVEASSLIGFLGRRLTVIEEETVAHFLAMSLLEREEGRKQFLRRAGLESAFQREVRRKAQDEMLLVLKLFLKELGLWERSLFKDRLDMPLRDLSGGQKRLIYLVRLILSVLTNPAIEVVTLDEPTIDLDERLRRLAIQALLWMREKKNLLLLASTLDLDLARALGSRKVGEVLFLKQDGRIIEQGPYEGLIEKRGALVAYLQGN